jgi:hypothetical protein
MYIGTTGVAINRSSSSLALAGVTFSDTLRDNQTLDGNHVESIVLHNQGASEGSGTAIYMGYQAAGVGIYGARILQIGYPSGNRSSDLSLQVHKNAPGDNADTSWLTGLKINRTTGLAEVPQGLESGSDIILDSAGDISTIARNSGAELGRLYWGVSGKVILAAASGAIYIRPNGYSSVTAQLSYTTDGLLTVPSVNVSGLTASRAVFTDGSKNLVSVATTGTGSVVLSADPTFTGTLTCSEIELSGLIATDPDAGVIALGSGSAKTVVLCGSNGYLGAFGSSGSVKQTITGSRGGNAALASLLTALANHGIIKNSTTA